jgi:hypothetical protein
MERLAKRLDRAIRATAADSSPLTHRAAITLLTHRSRSACGCSMLHLEIHQLRPRHHVVVQIRHISSNPTTTSVTISTPNASAITCAEEVARKIPDTYLEPDKNFIELREMAIDGTIDLLRGFSDACRDEFDEMQARQF